MIKLEWMNESTKTIFGYNKNVPAISTWVEDYAFLILLFVFIYNTCKIINVVGFLLSITHIYVLPHVGEEQF